MDPLEIPNPADIQVGIDSSKASIPSFLYDLFSAYYHLYTCPSVARLVATQARKLVDVSNSLQAWHASPYGLGGLRFVDSHSLTCVREIWKCWSRFDGQDNHDHDQNDPAIAGLKAKFEENLKAIRRVQLDQRVDNTGGRGLCYTAVRSAAPAADLDMPRAVNEVHQRFWREGRITTRSEEDTQEINPMFVTPESDGQVRMHWGLDPLLGFPLAEAFMTTKIEPIVRSAPEEIAALVKAVLYAIVPFYLWCQSFQQAWEKRNVVMRWFVGDAIAFGHALQGLAKGASRLTHWYRTRHSFMPLRIDGEDYRPESLTPAPLSFMVIDTSNLIDDLGALNVLMATSPLLENNLAATIFTEMLTRYHHTYKEEADNLLCGPLPTVALLLGLVCVEHSTNTSPYPGASHDAMTYHWLKTKSALPRDMPKRLYHTYERLRWKRPMAH